MKDEAKGYLKAGFGKGMISIQRRSEWPQNVWAVSSNGEVFEAQLENKEIGTYHGYPLSANDDFRDVVLREWAQR